MSPDSDLRENQSLSRDHAPRPGGQSHVLPSGKNQGPGDSSEGQLGCGQQPRGCGEVRRAWLTAEETQRPWLCVRAGEGGQLYHLRLATGRPAG